jgi:TetR/AcrR family transcriptional regulator, mexJK operon transcriptional repressor
LTETKQVLRARAKREQIREGARRTFLERGFSGASTDAIAAAAGVSKQTLYAYYPSKEELLFDVLRDLIEDGGPQEGFAAVCGTSMGSREEVRGALSALAGELVSALMRPEYVALVRVVIAETPRLPHLGELFRSAVPERVLGGVASLLRRGQEEGEIRPVDADAASRMFVGPLLTYVLMDGLFVGDGPPRPPAPERVEEVVDLFVAAIT